MGLSALWMLIGFAGATEIYRAELAGGTLSFTDSPSNPGFELWITDDHPPPPAHRVNHETFPLIDTWDDAILTASALYEVPAELIKAVCLAESGMNPNAKSHAGAMGLMQLMPQTAAGLGVTDPWNPEQSIDAGARYLSKMLQRFGQVRLALAAYNAGPGNVAKHGGVPPFEETQKYVPRVMEYYEMFLTARPIRLFGDE